MRNFFVIVVKEWFWLLKTTVKCLSFLLFKKDILSYFDKVTAGIFMSYFLSSHFMNHLIKTIFCSRFMAQIKTPLSDKIGSKKCVIGRKLNKTPLLNSLLVALSTTMWWQKKIKKIFQQEKDVIYLNLQLRHTLVDHSRGPHEFILEKITKILFFL